MDTSGVKILVFSKDVELCKSLKLYYKFCRDGITSEDGESLELENVIKKIKELRDRSLILIDDFEENGKWEGLPLLKRLKSLWFPYYKEEKNKIYIIPIIFLSVDEIWRLEVAMLRAGNTESFTENTSFIYHLDFLKGTFYLKIPFLLSDFNKIVNLAFFCKFETDISKIKLLSATISYEEHYGH